MAPGLRLRSPLASHPPRSPAISQDARSWSPVGSPDRDANGEGRAPPALRNARDRPAPSPSGVRTRRRAPRSAASSTDPAPAPIQIESREADTIASSRRSWCRGGGLGPRPRDDAAELSGRRMPRRSIHRLSHTADCDRGMHDATSCRPAPVADAAATPPELPTSRRGTDAARPAITRRIRSQRCHPLSSRRRHRRQWCAVCEPGPGTASRGAAPRAASTVPPPQSDAPSVQVTDRQGRDSRQPTRCAASHVPRRSRQAAASPSSRWRAAHLNRNYR